MVTIEEVATRLCLDPRDLNKALKRPHYPMVTIEEVATRLSGAQLFTSLDACSGFWQLPLDIESSRLLTFNTPWGRYRFTRLPFGIVPAPEIYQREMWRLFQGLPVKIIMDDFFIHGNTNDIQYRLEVLEHSTATLPRSGRTAKRVFTASDCDQAAFCPHQKTRSNCVLVAEKTRS